ncbi:MAG: hypothetical protein ACFB51_05430 [Anaerolineae bacterium]
MTNPPELGGSRRSSEAPGLKSEYEALRSMSVGALETGDTDAVTAMGARALTHVIAITGAPSRSDRVRSYGAMVLGELRAVDAVPTLARVLEREVARRDGVLLILEIVDALERIGTPAAHSAIENAGLANRGW